MLTVSRRGTSPRHQTLRAAVEWSYRLWHAAPSGALWERLSVFAGTFDVRGRRAGVRGRRPAAVGDRPTPWSAWVDKSVVLRDAADPSRVPAARRAARVRGRTGSPRRGGARALPRPSRHPLRRHGQGIRRAVPWQHPPFTTAGRGDGTEVNQVAASRALHRDYENIRAVLSHALGAQETAGPHARCRP